MADKSKTVIVKKIKKGHAGHHGGSWKVAYADFMTAMMAFFLLMWLISMVEPEKRAAVADYFRNYNVFKESGRSFMSSSSGIREEIKTTIKEPAAGVVAAKDIQSKINLSLDNRLRSLKDQVLVDIVDSGIRIQIIDLEGSPMFKPGSAIPTEKCRQILLVVAETIRDLKMRISIEGHTDSVGSATARDSNWDLSSLRASVARKLLERNGIDQALVSKVVGYADTELLIKENSTDPRNRRISLILMSEPEKKEGVSLEPNLPALQIIPPSGAPAADYGKSAPKKEDTGHRVIDPGIKPQKPINVGPTLFPNIDR
jgi:chemotaxis protein MotB